ncbi:hypothetical protein GCM10009760_59490 [Kitasatospora kazusensis]|uniref:Uncharacterized protein n=1 Tax=Kitasatospora kazusensis TaxID=407974 RepID=A0ABN3AA77_9ACTN
MSLSGGIRAQAPVGAAPDPATPARSRPDAAAAGPRGQEGGTSAAMTGYGADRSACRW